MALARRTRHNSDASRSTSSRSTSSRRDDSRFECLIVFDVFRSDNDDFGSHSVSNCISPRPPLASFSFRTGAPERSSIDLDLSKRGHWFVQPSAVLQAEFPAVGSCRRGLAGTLALRLQTQAQCLH